MSEATKKEVLISVDVETDGPIPGDYSILSLGACLVKKPDIGFYLELKPVSNKFIQEYLNVSRLNRNKLITEGIDPITAMQRFSHWIDKVCEKNNHPVFVAFNATFDWMFVHWYFEHFLGINRDPFGHSGWDIKAYYAGVTRKLSWSETSKSKMSKNSLSSKSHTHHALDDAREQADIFQRLQYTARSMD